MKSGAYLAPQALYSSVLWNNALRIQNRWFPCRIGCALRFARQNSLSSSVCRKSLIGRCTSCQTPKAGTNMPASKRFISTASCAQPRSTHVHVQGETSAQSTPQPAASWLPRAISVGKYKSPRSLQVYTRFEHSEVAMFSRSARVAATVLFLSALSASAEPSLSLKLAGTFCFTSATTCTAY